MYCKGYGNRNSPSYENLKSCTLFSQYTLSEYLCNFTKYGSLFNDAFWTLFLCSSHKISTIHAIFNSNFFPSFGKVALSSVSMPLSLLWSNSVKHSVIFSVLGYLARCHCLLEFIGRKDSISIFFFIFRHFSPLFWLNFMFLATLWKRGSV